MFELLIFFEIYLKAMSSKKFRPIILAGGSGKRLWPLSTKQRPKQFISLFGDLSLFDLTLQRINNRDLFTKPIIVTSEEYLSFVEESLSKTGLEVERVILEPESKNTFSALALPVLASIKQNREERYREQVDSKGDISFDNISHRNG